MKHTKEKQKASLMKRRTRAIIIGVAALALLIVAMVLVLEYAQTTIVTDADGTNYYIRKRDGVYALYDAEKNPVPTEEQFGYYVTEIGTLIRVDPETGEYEIIALVDIEGTETYAFDTRIMIFPSVSKANILSIEVHNSTGSYTFCRYNAITGEIDPKGDFIIESSPTTLYDEDFFSKMYVAAGYTMTLQKVTGPADADGNPTPPIKRDEHWNPCTHTAPCACDYKEYGLAACSRVDDKGTEYFYEPAYYILTDVDGNRHKVIVGDMLPDESGYYVQYVDISGKTEVKRDTVYVMNPDMGETMNAAIEEYVKPTLTYPMTSTTYFDVQDFTVVRLQNGATPDDENPYGEKPVISFSYIDLSERQNTLQANFPYTFSLNWKGYTPDVTSIEQSLRSLYEPNYVKVCKLNPTHEDLASYGLYAKDENGEFVPHAPYVISFKYDVPEGDGEVSGTLLQRILLAKDKETGNYYAYTMVYRADNNKLLFSYNTVLEISRHSLAFLEWEEADWISKTYINFDVAFVTSIQLNAPDYWAEFLPDNSNSVFSNGINTNRMEVTAKDSTGKELTTVGELVFEDVSGGRWVITPTEILLNDKKISSDYTYYETSLVDREVLCLKDENYINCSDKIVKVGPNSVYIEYHNGTTETIPRYGTHIFLDYYDMLGYSAMIDDYPLTPEEEAALIGNSANFLLSLTLKTEDTDGTTDTTVYSFYRISAHKAYIMINGRGGFCVKMNRVQKFISDAQKFMNLEPIDPTAKY
ncbi:MAG: hypothetical protein IJD64_04450 [Clostridia bacterium]|nr:hypothetical protein [Clostridia bacterium]